MSIKLENNSGHSYVLKPLVYQHHLPLTLPFFGVGRDISLVDTEMSLQEGKTENIISLKSAV